MIFSLIVTIIVCSDCLSSHNVTFIFGDVILSFIFVGYTKLGTFVPFIITFNSIEAIIFSVRLFLVIDFFTVKIVIQVIIYVSYFFPA